VFGRSRADTVRKFVKRVNILNDRLEQEYLEDCTDPNIGWNDAQEQSGGADI